jgi:hypothetical protein
MTTPAPDSCATCYGQGEIVTDQGPLLCRDCMGHGKVAGRPELIEWRLRDIEQSHPGSAHGCDDDVRWLVTELRRSREALTQIFARCQDAAEDDALAADIRYVANGTLGLYPVEKSKVG